MQNLSIPRSIYPFAMVALMFISLYALANSSLFWNAPTALSMAIIGDLAVTIPLVYYFLIRKKSIPNTTVGAMAVLGIVLAPFILPEGHRGLAEELKLIAVPIIELVVLFSIAWKVRALAQKVNKEKEGTPDFYLRLKIACKELLPSGVSHFFASEISAFYYAFFAWKKSELKNNEFSYHKKNGVIALLAVVILLILGETVAFHLLLQQWSELAAWILTGLSLYSGVTILGLLRSIPKRPIRLEGQTLHMPYGFMGDAQLPLENIERIEALPRGLEYDEHTRKLSPLGDLEQANILITFKESQRYEGPYGISRTCKALAVYIDDKERFLALFAE